MIGRWRDESGQALVFSTLMTGIVLVLLALGAIGAAFLISARAALGKAADAGALAALAQSSGGMTLQVSFVDYTCRAGLCTAQPGQISLPVSGGGAFATNPGTGFGPLPGWAAQAGCVGTVWPGTAGSAGLYRVCTGQQVESAGVSEPGHAQMQEAAQQWLAANVGMDGQIYAAHVTDVTVGHDGQVTVSATASVRPGLLMFRSVSVAETAWPGRLG